MSISTSSLARVLLACLSALTLSNAAQAATNVGVSINVSQPGFFGRIDLGGQPPPPVIYAQPIIVQQSPVTMQQRPIYLRVPPGHSKDWARYCGRYSACGQPVYFVRDEPRQRDEGRDERRDNRGDDRGDDRGDGRREDRNDYRDRGDEGRGRGEGHGHGRGHNRD